MSQDNNEIDPTLYRVELEQIILTMVESNEKSCEEG